MQVESLADQSDLRTVAYRIGAQSTVGELCGDLALMKPEVEIMTRDLRLADELEAECPGSGATVTVLAE